MRTIKRNQPPACLGKQPAQQDWRAFMRSPCHAEVRDSLNHEQKGLCCYCEIAIGEGDSHIEHMEPRGERAARTYDYSNLALSCNGGAVEHCGRFKDDRKKNRNHTWNAVKFSSPHDPATAALFRYDIQGGIAATDVDSTKADYLIGYLGLNCARLSERRRHHAVDLVETLGEQPDSEILAWLRRDYLQPDDTGCLKQFPSLSRAILEP